jgi:phage gp36-like protein
MSTDCATCIVYATIDDLDGTGIPPASLVGVKLQAVQKMLMRVSRIADTYLRDRYHLPLRCPIDPALTQWVVDISVWYLMKFRGFNPNAGQIDMAVRMGYDDAIKSLTRVANGQQQLCVRQASPVSDQPAVATSPSRGFTAPGGEDYPVIGPNTWGS